MPTVTSVSVTASPVVLMAEVAGVSAKADRGSMEMAGTAAIPNKSLRRSGEIRPRLVSSDMSTPSGFQDLFSGLAGFEDTLGQARLPTFVHCTDTQDRVYCTAK